MPKPDITDPKKRKARIKEAVRRTIKEYGEALKKLAKE